MRTHLPRPRMTGTPLCTQHIETSAQGRGMIPTKILSCPILIQNRLCPIPTKKQQPLTRPIQIAPSPYTHPNPAKLTLSPPQCPSKTHPAHRCPPDENRQGRKLRLSYVTRNCRKKSRGSSSLVSPPSPLHRRNLRNLTLGRE